MELVSSAIMSGQAGYIAAALRVVAEARGIAQIASNAGVPAATLEKELGEGNPTLATILCVLSALDLQLDVRHVEPGSLQVDFG
ncbi:hypothetical protein GCM10007036_09620 [Alsobacter metallidurans]|uniref:Addiction module antidote protein n=1 Tax=Alsobacter metallidurans TaxID=340221 RepID=A0A917I549_9HYPH|nr:hypothetical protein GCM10007036_09620 [Alsobacter metallidurans]